MLLKCYTQFSSKFEKLSSGHGTGKSQFSFESQRKAMSKNAQTIAQLYSSHMLARFVKLVFNSVWTKNFQMFKLDLEKAPEIKLPTSIGSSKKQESSRKTSTAASLTMLKPLTVWVTANCGKFFKKMGIPDEEYQLRVDRCTWPVEKVIYRTTQNSVGWRN